MRIPVLAALLCLAAAPIPAVELVVNGDFEQPLSPSWQIEISGVDALADRAVTYDPDPDYEARCHKTTGIGYARLYQTIDLQSTEVRFSAQLLPSAMATGDAWSAAGLSLIYLDAARQPLGETFLGTRTVHCPWADSPTFHSIDLDPSVWQETALALPDELVNLPGVDPFAIRTLQVMVRVEVYDC